MVAPLLSPEQLFEVRNGGNLSDELLVHILGPYDGKIGSTLEPLTKRLVILVVRGITRLSGRGKLLRLPHGSPGDCCAALFLRLCGVPFSAEEVQHSTTFISAAIDHLTTVTTIATRTATPAFTMLIIIIIAVIISILVHMDVTIINALVATGRARYR
jgi:hypothetical protein